MKKTSTLLCVIIMLITAGTLCAQQATQDLSLKGKNVPLKESENPSYKSRRVYCVSMYNPYLDGKHGVTVFNTGDPSGSMQLLHQYDPDYSIYAGAAANDTYYAYFYRYGGRGPEPIGIRSVNLRTGEETVVADWIGKPAAEWPKFQDMTYDYTTNTMYAIGFEYGSTYLYTIDLTTGELQKGIKIKRVVSTIAANNEGVLYVIDMEGTLCTLDKENGVLTDIMPTEFPPSLNQTMEFDRTDGTLYWATAQFGIQESFLIRFDLENNTYENLGVLGGVGTQVVGMYIPFLQAGDDAPGAPTQITATPGSNGANNATITWTNPTETFGNTPLLEITSLTISRNGETIKTYDQVEDLVLGKAMTFEDNDVQNGMYVYSIAATNTAGTGEEGKIDCFVGADTPAKIGNFQITINAPCKSATMTWEAPTEGEHKGHYDNSGLTYKIVRYPDETTIAQNLETPAFTDETSGRLTGYTYKVYAINNAGESKPTESKKVVLGDALPMPYSFNFIDESVFNNTWSVYDNNIDAYGSVGDGTTFQIGSPFGKAYFGDKSLQPAAEYMMQDESIGPKEWLISPPIKFEKGTPKVLTFGVRNVGLDHLTVTMGNNNTIESQVIQIQSFDIQSKRLAESGGDPIPFTQLSIQFGDITGTYCIGFYLDTPAGNSVIFQLGDVYLGEPTSISGNELDALHKVFTASDALHITGEYTSAQVYNANGILMGETGAATSQISTSGWPKGVYYVKIMSGNASDVLKTIVR